MKMVSAHVSMVHGGMDTDAKELITQNVGQLTMPYGKDKHVDVKTDILQ